MLRNNPKFIKSVMKDTVSLRNKLQKKKSMSFVIEKTNNCEFMQSIAKDITHFGNKLQEKPEFCHLPVK